MANAANISERGSDGISFEKPIPASQPGDTFPAGAVLDYVGSAAPTGWLILDGSTISRASYPNLRDVMLAGGSAIGVGDGSTTMVLPDCRQRVVVGKHASGTFATMGATGGAETHTLTQAQTPSHSHTIPNHAHSVTDPGHLHVYTNRAVANSSTGYASGAFFVNQIVVNGANSELVSTAFTGISIPSSGGGGATSSIGSDGSHNNLQPYIVLNKIIRAY